MSDRYLHWGSLPGETEFPDGWGAYTNPTDPWGQFEACSPGGRTYTFRLPSHGRANEITEVFHNGESTGFYVCIFPDDPYGSVKIAREFWD